MAATTTKNILIFGGSGKVAKHITRLLATQPPPPPHKFTVHSIIRNPDSRDEISSLGAQPIIQSIETSNTSTLAQTLRSTSAEAVLWCAGAGGKGGPERTRAVDRDGAIRVMDACVEAGVKRLIVISAVDVRDRETKPEPEWYVDSDRERSVAMWEKLGPYMVAKLEADKELVTGNNRRGLDYTIVRPGRLLDEPGKGTVSAGKVDLSPGISREDVAAVVVQCLLQDATKGLAFDCMAGDTPVAEAVAQVARDRVDTFAGRY